MAFSLCGHYVMRSGKQTRSACRRQKGHLVARAASTSRLGGGNSGAPARAARLAQRVRLTAVLQHLVRQVITLRRSIQNFISQH